MEIKNEVMDVRFVRSRINKLSKQIRDSLAMSNSAMDNGDWESAIAAETSFIKSYQEWHKEQAARRPKDGVSR